MSPIGSGGGIGGMGGQLDASPVAFMVAGDAPEYDPGLYSGMGG